MASPLTHLTGDDAQIITDLQRLQLPISESEKNIWAFWDKGLQCCPPWGLRNIAGWVRRLQPHGWTVRVLDAAEGSPTHYSKVVDSSFFPPSLLNGTMKGPHVAPHSSDMIRLPLLYLYDGVWLDVGFMLFRGLNDFCWDKLADPKTPFEMAAFAINMGPNVGMILNGFIAARKGNSCIKHWHETFVKVWAKADSSTGLSNHPLLHHLPRYEPPSRNGKLPPFTYAQFADYLAQGLCLERVRHLKDPSVGWDGPEYFRSNVLLFDGAPEVYLAQRMTEWNGRKQFELLLQPRENADSSTSEYKEADALVTAIINTSATMKISHSLVTAGREYLAELWDKQENWDCDSRKGTFGAYLRKAAEDFEQKRVLTPVLLPDMGSGAHLTGAVLEVQGNPRQE